MKTNKTNLKSRIFAVMVSIMLLATCFMSTTASAIETKDTTFEFNKVLTMDENANVPDVNFAFTIAPGDVDEANNISAGVGNPTIGIASFNPSDETEPAGDGFKTATDKVTVDFTNVTFNAPGIYRYEITENPGAEPEPGITYSNEVRYLDVYVQNKTEGEGLEIFGYAMRNEASIDDGTKLGDDAAAFNNTYTTYDLDLKKVVDGNQGDKNKPFNFTIKITGAKEGTKFTVAGADTEAGELATLTVTDGKAEGTYALKDSETVTVYGLTTDMDYQIVEDDYSAQGYKTAYVVNTDPSADGRDTGVKDITTTTTTNTVTFTNTKDGTVPTGILLETAPYMILGAVVLAGIVVLFVTRRRRSH